MALPNYLAQIKSSGIYRFVWDKSEIAGVPAETLRLVVGYSEKGPFNTPVYIKSAAEFKSVFGDISKKLEKRGVFFHRMALQALSAGPILALNLKKFTPYVAETETQTPAQTVAEGESSTPSTDTTTTPNGEAVKAVSFNVADATVTLKSVGVEKIYDTTRFWKLDPEAILSATGETNKYISMTSADSKETSCSVFIRGYRPTGYDVTVASWYSSIGEEVPDYFTPEGKNYTASLISDYFAEVYVFRGKFTKELCASAPLNQYFDVDSTTGEVSLKSFVKDAFGNYQDTLTLLANDEASNFLNSYSGILLPGFKNQNGTYISLDLAFNADNSLHNMMMNLNADLLYGGDVKVNQLITTGYTEEGYKVFGTEFEPTVDTCSVDKDGNQTWTSGTVNGAYGANFYDYIIANGGFKPSTLGLKVGDRIIPDGESTLYTICAITDSDDGVRIFNYEGEEKVFAKSFKKCVFPVSISSNSLKPWYFEGYVYVNSKPIQDTDEGMDHAKLEWQRGILSALTEYKGIRTGLTNRKDVDYRYIVDTFEGLVCSELHKELALIAKEKDNAVAFLNFPSMKTFKTCTYTKFIDSNSDLQVKYIADGANLKQLNGELFSLVSEVNGASYVSYNTPLVFTDGTIKTTVPSAALVSNNFMEKYTSRQPYYVVAGPTYGKMLYQGMIGPDYNFTRADLDILEPMGVNCMVYVPRLGTYINSNQTAKQNPVTALSKLNVRELVIYLQDQIELLLQSYQWEFNTPYLRDLIKSKADTICERIKNNGGLYQYLNVCDESNNTDDVINNEMFVLSTSIEPGMGCGKMVHELTIYRKGGMQSVIK